MVINLGTLAINEARKSLSWVNDMQLYRWMRFFGFSSKRLMREAAREEGTS